jgi:hypothetical protein
MQECRKAGRQEYRKAGMQEYRKDGGGDGGSGQGAPDFRPCVTESPGGVRLSPPKTSSAIFSKSISMSKERGEKEKGALVVIGGGISPPTRYHCLRKEEHPRM